MKTAAEAALRLSVENRLALIERLWESIEDECGDHLDVSPEVKAELDRRLIAHRRAPQETLSWSEIRR